MAVDGHLNFDTKIITKGFDKGIESLKTTFLKLGGVIAGVFSVRVLTAYAKEAKALWQTQLEAETKLETVLGRNLGATKAQIQAVKDYASALQEVGVIGDEVQLSGLQELATYIESADSLKTMNEVLNDMLAQQYGLNATAESAVSIATMLGKVLNGQTGALSRYGYSFDEAQEQLLKFGTEEQRVATLAQVVEASVGGMNEALANTDAGRLKQLDNTLGDIKEQFGAAVTQIEVVFLPLLKRVADFLTEIADLARDISQSMAEVFGSGNAKAVSTAAQSYEDIAEAAEEAAESNDKSLMAFDRINKIGGDETSSESESGANTPFVMADDEQGEGRFAEFFRSLKESWDKYAVPIISSLKSKFGDIKTRVQELWNNIDFQPLLTSLTGLYDALTPLAEDAWSGLLWLWDNFLTPIADWVIEDALPATIDLITAALGLLKAAINKLKPLGKWLWDKFLKPMGAFAGAVVIGFLEDLTDLLEDLTDLLNGDTSLEDFVGQLNGVQAALLALGVTVGGVKIVGGIRRLITTLGAVQAPGWITGIATFFTVTLPQTVLPAVTGFFTNTLLPAISGFFTQTLPAFFSTAVGSVVAVLGAFFAGWGIGTLLKKYLLDPVFDFQDAFNTGMDVIAEWFRERVDDFITGGEMIGKFIAEDVPEFFRSVPDRIMSFFAGIGMWFTRRFQEAYDGIVRVFRGIGNWFGKRYDDVVQVFRDIGSWFGDIFSAAYDAVTEAFSGIGEFFSGLWNGITEGVRGMVNGVIDAVNYMISGINDVSFSLPDWDWLPDGVQGATLGFDIPEIPRLAQGTVVPANYGEFLAVLGDNKRETEVVSPVSTIEQAVMSALVKLGGAGGQKQSLTVQVVLDKRIVGQAVIDDINERTRRTGYSPIKA